MPDTYEVYQPLLRPVPVVPLEENRSRPTTSPTTGILRKVIRRGQKQSKEPQPHQQKVTFPSSDEDNEERNRLRGILSKELGKTLKDGGLCVIVPEKKVYLTGSPGFEHLTGACKYTIPVVESIRKKRGILSLRSTTKVRKEWTSRNVEAAIYAALLWLTSKYIEHIEFEISILNGLKTRAARDGPKLEETEKTIRLLNEKKVDAERRKASYEKLQLKYHQPTSTSLWSDGVPFVINSH